MLGQARPRILCVSLSSFQLKAMCESLPRRDYEVFQASTPEQAVAVCVNNHLAAVVLDSDFASSNGWSVAQTLRIINPHLPILLVANGHDGDLPAGVNAVASSFADILSKLQLLLTQR
jgi:CheY-like chemotaxis protein